jgi:hypothetical protein
MASPRNGDERAGEWACILRVERVGMETDGAAFVPKPYVLDRLDVERNRGRGSDRWLSGECCGAASHC